MEKKLTFARRAVLGLALSVFAASACSAEEFSLGKALLMARKNDPTYLATRAKLDAALARRSQARSYLLPQLAVKGSATRTDRDYETIDSPFGDTTEVTKYDGYSAQLTLTQSIYRRANFLGVSQANAALDQAQEEALAADQDLLLRLASTWFGGMSTEDLQTHAESRSDAARRQWDQLEKASSIDLASTPALAEARAKYEQAAAERIAAASDRESKLSELEEIVGPLPAVGFPTLASTYTPPALPGRSLEDWLAIADADNPTVNAARAALLAANAEVHRQQAGHEPTIDLVSNYSLNNQGEGNFPGQAGYNILQKSIGLEFNMPLYQGGMQSAKVREALALRSQAEQDLHGAMRTARSIARNAWFAWQSEKARQVAGLQSVRAAALSLRAATVGVSEEIKFDLDVLEAREQLLDAWSTAQKARYGMIMELFKLKAVIGVLRDEDLLEIEQYSAARSAEVQSLAERRY